MFDVFCGTPVEKRGDVLMKRSFPALIVSVVLVALAIAPAHAQKEKWMVGGNMLLSIASGGGGSSTGFTFGPMAEVVFSKQFAVGSEFNINTQAGTPIEWPVYFKYYIAVPRSNIKPYVDSGFSLLFLTGGPYFGIRFGGGVLFNVAKSIYVGPDLQLGPVFATGSTIFFIMIRGGMRYEIP
jgi:hypothetical protein